MLQHHELLKEEFDLLKETPKGYWINIGDKNWPISKWVPKKSKKRFAYPTEKEALVNFIKRTEKREKYLKRDLYACQEGLKLANELNDGK
jgi:hypothetical protein